MEIETIRINMKIPSIEQTLEFVNEAESLNPGPWAQHSKHVAEAAQAIALHHSQLDPDAAYVMGYLHDIGRRTGINEMRHTIDGYIFLDSQGFSDAARICLTHSFPIQNPDDFLGVWDCTEAELEFVKRFIAEIRFTKYDRLIQLCDILALPTGCCLLEKRMVDIALRHGINDHTIDRWKVYFDIQKDFEDAIGQSIYHILPNVFENTFS